ncbi:hypothetical protein ABRQ22_17320 [Cellulosimicrobium sp. ES-005]|uniref:Uncharacterized protein n=1 Tax=Cellulosimicrobium sp. ES-005 TaxID=3163031 RepID=A0AAU8FYN5_9MICO
MTDDLLDEATRLADNSPGVGVGPLLRALVERVQQAEAEARHLRSIATREVAAHETQVARLAAERDVARGKLDKVREAVTAELDCLLHDDDDPVQCGWKRTVRDVLAILDGKTGD